MPGFGASVVLVLLLAPSAPTPAERKAPAVKRVLWESTSGYLGPNSKSAAERESSRIRLPWLRVYTSVDELAKEFVEPDAVRKKLAEEFDPRRHVILFARWPSWCSYESIEPTVDENGRVVFLYRYRYQHGCATGIVKRENNLVYVIDKNAKWALGIPDDNEP